MKLPGMYWAIVFCALLPVTADAAIDGNQLLKECIDAVKVSDGNVDKFQSNDLIDSVHCTAFIEGYNAANKLLTAIPGNKAYYCLPEDGIPPDQSARILVKWLKENPEHLNEPANFLMIYAFSKAFPCKVQSEKELEVQPRQIL